MLDLLKRLGASLLLAGFVLLAVTAFSGTGWFFTGLATLVGLLVLDWHTGHLGRAIENLNENRAQWGYWLRYLLVGLLVALLNEVVSGPGKLLAWLGLLISIFLVSFVVDWVLARLGWYKPTSLPALAH